MTLLFDRLFSNRISNIEQGIANNEVKSEIRISKFESALVFCLVFAIFDRITGLKTQ